ncbi:hypothetical protein ACLMJK_003299 [Lecanora helva]
MALEIHDVLIIGAGPAGLAVAARLREPTPSAIFTDAEHNRYHWIKKYEGRMTIQRQGKHSQWHKPFINDPPSSRNDGHDIKVLDSSGSAWLSSWKKNFAALDISHLRSPMFFHPCPGDRDGLLAFAHETGRSDQCIEIANCVGKSMSKHRRKKKIAKGGTVGSAEKAVLEIDERDRKDYFTPSANIFHDYCDAVVHRYSLDHLVEEMQVASIAFDFPDAFDVCGHGKPNEKLFKVTGTDGAAILARIVVLAVGAGGIPSMPYQLSIIEREGASHSTQLAKQPFLTENMKQRIRSRMSTAVVVVGGGLTAAQIADKCIASGVNRVLMVMRSGLKQRLDMLLKARNGGSITPRFFKRLQEHVARGALSIHTQTTIKKQYWDPGRKVWEIETDPSVTDLARPVDYIYYATGIKPDIERLPFLSPLRENFPIDVKGGMPCLTEDLAWAEDVPLFVTGRLAGLRIGPDCGNLEGARVGAERISWAVEEIMERRKDSVSSNRFADNNALMQRVGSVNIYDSLDIDS